MAKIRKQHFDPKNTFFSTVPRILLIMIASGLLLLILSALLAYRSSYPLKLAGILSPACLLIASFASGYTAGSISERPVSYLSSIATSAVFTLFLVLLRLLVPPSTNTIEPAISFLLHSLIIVSSLLGVLISERFRSPRKKKRYKSRRLK